MHIYFSGIGGTGIGPLAMIAQQAGFSVSGSDKQDSEYFRHLKQCGITNIHIGQDLEQIKGVHESQPIDWLVYSSAVPIENPDAPELQFCSDNNIKATRRDDFMNFVLDNGKLKLIGIAGTHGKTTTTAMTVWLAQQVGMKASHLLPAKTSFAEMGDYKQDSEYFILECDEFDRTFLSYKPYISLISGVDYDHPDIYLTRDDYQQAFRDYINQSNHTLLWQIDSAALQIKPSDSVTVLPDNESNLNQLRLFGLVNRRDAWLVIQAINRLTKHPVSDLIEHMNKFPGISRRFEKIADHVYSDYAHTPEKIRGAIQMSHEIADDKVVVIYEGLHNTRQHFIKDDLFNLFDSVKKFYVVPSYLAREDESLDLLTPSDIVRMTSQPNKGVATDKNENLKQIIITHQQAGDLVLCLTAGGGGSLDEWLRKEFKQDESA